MTETFDFFEVGAAAGDEFEWGRVHHFVGHDVDVEVDDLRSLECEGSLAFWDWGFGEER